ncbi:hypothetical protein LIER_18392 [Lithospermum erythrorhizon]|uniref:Uncharacterized protein n=1 Tax=Lithospermum erythrorhizon TaxID=34254 RepID=A0AAV3QET6_LITER
MTVLRISCEKVAKPASSVLVPRRTYPATLIEMASTGVVGPPQHRWGVPVLPPQGELFLELLHYTSHYGPCLSPYNGGARWVTTTICYRSWVSARQGRGWGRLAYAFVAWKTIPYKRMDLTFVASRGEESKSVVEMPTSVVMVGAKKWRHTSIAYILGYNPSYSEMEGFVESSWSEHGEIKGSRPVLTVADQCRSSGLQQAGQGDQPVQAGSNAAREVVGQTSECSSPPSVLQQAGLVLSPIEEERVSPVVVKSTYASMVATSAAHNTRKKGGSRVPVIIRVV